MKVIVKDLLKTKNFFMYQTFPYDQRSFVSQLCLGNSVPSQIKKLICSLNSYLVLDIAEQIPHHMLRYLIILHK